MSEINEFIDFEPIFRGGTKFVTVRLQDVGTAPLNITPPTVSGTGFSVATPITKSVLQPQESATIVLRFDGLYPNEPQTYVATCGLDGFGNQLYGDPVSVTIPDGSFYGNSQAESNALALAAAQSQAEAQLVCHWENAEQTATCPAGYTGTPVTIAAHTHAYDSTISQADADALALAAATNALSCTIVPPSPPWIPPWGFDMNNDVYGANFLTDGSMLITGAFSSVGGYTRTGIVKLDPSVVIDATYDPDPNSLEFDAIPLTTGNMLLAGSYNRSPNRYAIAAFDSTGALIAAFDPNPDQIVRDCYQVLTDKILVIGGFTSFLGATRNGAVLLNSDLTLDTSFADPGFTLFVGAGRLPYSSIVLLSGKFLIVGGYLNVAGSSPAIACAAVINTDGTVDTSFNATVVPVTYGVWAAAEQSDGKIILVGDFSSVDGHAVGKIARVSATGAWDSGFVCSVTSSFTLQGCVILTGGKILIGGVFTAVNGTARTNLAIINSDGSLDTLDPSTNGQVYRIVVLNGYVWVMGSFTTIYGENRGRIARLNMDGTLA